MKKIVFFHLFLLIFLFSSDLFSQQDVNLYQSIFDRSIDMAFKLHLPSEHSNNKKVYFGSNFGDSFSYFLESLLVMYESTNDEKYLMDFLKASNQVISYRDDKIDSLNKHPFWSTKDRRNNVLNTEIDKYLSKHPEASVFSDNGPDYKSVTCPGPISYQNALILMPMSHFVYLSKKLKTNEFDKPFNQIFTTFNQVQISNFNQYSNWIVRELFEVNNDSEYTTYEYFEKYYWIKNRGYRQYANDEFYKKGKDVDAMDRNSNWGVVNTYLAAAFKGEKNEEIYLNKSMIALRELKKCLNLHYTKDSVPYYQWSYAGWTKKNKYRDLPSDDISHAGAVIDLVSVGFQFRYELGLKNKNGDYFFSNEVMTKIQNTLLFSVYDSPLKFHHAVNGSCSFYKWPNCEMGDFIMTYSLARWLRLSYNFQENTNKLINSKVYSVINNFYSKFIENPTLIYSNTIVGDDGKFKLYGGSIGSTLLGLSLASKFSSKINIVARLSIEGIEELTTIEKSGEDFEFVYKLQNKEGYYSSLFIPNSKIVIDGGLKVDFKSIGFEFLIPQKIDGNFEINKYNKGVIKSDDLFFIQDASNSIFVSKTINLNLQKIDFKLVSLKSYELIAANSDFGIYDLIFYDSLHFEYHSIKINAISNCLISDELIDLPQNKIKYQIWMGDFYGEGKTRMIFIDKDHSCLFVFKSKGVDKMVSDKYELPIDIVFNDFSVLEGKSNLKSDFLVGRNSNYGLIVFNLK